MNREMKQYLDELDAEQKLGKQFGNKSFSSEVFKKQIAEQVATNENFLWYIKPVYDCILAPNDDAENLRKIRRTILKLHVLATQYEKTKNRPIILCNDDTAKHRYNMAQGLGLTCQQCVKVQKIYYVANADTLRKTANTLKQVSKQSFVATDKKTATQHSLDSWAKVIENQKVA